MHFPLLITFDIVDNADNMAKMVPSYHKGQNDSLS